MQSNNTPESNAADVSVLGLLAVAKGLEDRIERAMAEVQLSVAKYGVLTQLVDATEAIPLSELAARVNCVRSNVTQMVDRLETEGLVRRIPSPLDRRIILAELTADGRERQKAGQQRLGLLQAGMAATIRPEERDSLTRAMQAIR